MEENEILICTMGLSPGVVTRMTQYLQQKRQGALSEVWVVRTSHPQIGLLFEDIVRREFLEGDIIQGLVLEEKTLSPPDTIEESQVRSFANEFSEFLTSKVTADGPIVHLCISGGRKSMTYAATMAFVKLVGTSDRWVVKAKLALWHIQLPSEDEASASDIKQLWEQYRQARKITVDEEIDQDKRKALLYPPMVEIRVLPFLYLDKLNIQPLGDDLWEGGLPEERR